MQQIIKLVDKAQKFNRSLSAAIESLGAISLLLIMTITCVDVIGAKAFLTPVPGALDIVMLAQTIAISFSVAATLSAGGHVSVEIFLKYMPPWLKRIVSIITEGLSLLLFVLIVWQLMEYGHQFRVDGESSPTARIPLYPFAYGIALATIPACIELCARIIKTILGK